MSKIKFTENDKKLFKANNLHSRSEMDYENKFNRFGVIDPYRTLGKTREYIFFTKPDLQLLDSSGSLNSQLKNIPFFVEAKSRWGNMMKQLQSSVSNRPYINILSNTVKSSLELPTITSTEVENSANIFGDVINYRWSSEESSKEHEFSLEFNDTKYIEVYMLFRIWDEYVNKKVRGYIIPPSKYVLNKILHDQISVYKIIVDEDGETIIHYSKLYGVYPINVPRDVFGNMNDNGGLSLNINFKAAFVDDMDPLIIDDFNYIYESYKGIGSSKDIPIYDKKNACMNNSWVKIPYIKRVSKEFGPGFRYKLKWR